MKFVFMTLRWMTNFCQMQIASLPNDIDGGVAASFVNCQMLQPVQPLHTLMASLALPPLVTQLAALRSGPWKMTNNNSDGHDLLLAALILMHFPWRKMLCLCQCKLKHLPYRRHLIVFVWSGRSKGVKGWVQRNSFSQNRWLLLKLEEVFLTHRREKVWR